MVLLQICVVLSDVEPFEDNVLVNVYTDSYWLLGCAGCITYEPKPLAVKLLNALLITEAFKVVSVCSLIVLDINSSGRVSPELSEAVSWY